MIITFYSYKGGVGRTQLLAHIANYLAYYKSKKILIIDWDLEAPGIDRFYPEFKRKNKKKGLIELLLEYNQFIRKDDTSKEFPFFTEEHIHKISDKIDLIPAGNYNNDYRDKINAFNWTEFYEDLGGKYYIEYLKKELKKTDYDYVLIDSRTGVTDYSGICNIQMPDMNVIVVAPTKQNFEGASQMVSDIKNSPYTKDKFREPFIIPILSRIDQSEEKSLQKWHLKFREDYENGIDNLLSHLSKFIKISQNTNTYIEQSSLHYVKELAYGEKLLLTEKPESIYSGLSNKFANIAEIIEVINLEYNFKLSKYYTKGYVTGDLKPNYNKIEKPNLEQKLRIKFNPMSISQLDIFISKLIGKPEAKGFDTGSFLNKNYEEKIAYLLLFFATKKDFLSNKIDNFLK